MKIFRITKKKYQDDLSGKGAELFGGRWNPVGIPALYTSESRALCILELLVHTSKELAPPSFIIQSLNIAKKFEKLIVKLDLNKLDDGWNDIQHPEWTEKIGEKYFNKGNLGIMVPSSIVEFESNLVLNPQHKNYNEVVLSNKVELELDGRLFK